MEFFEFQKKKKRKGEWVQSIFKSQRVEEKDKIFSSTLWIFGSFLFSFLFLFSSTSTGKNFCDINLFPEMTKMETRKIAYNQKNPLLNE